MKNSKKFNNEKMTQLNNQSKDLKKHFFKEVTQMAKKHEKNY